jgi:glycosyltransferase involved in cell wall biosynthesis
MRPDVTICIPAYAAEQFIDKTLECARSQTHSNIKISVSVDLSTDHTAELCLKHAGEDPRITVHVQQQRLGWSENANFLLDRVDTDFFFLYFHDDFIDPEYVKVLLDALKERPDAVSAHCDLQEYGLVDAHIPAYTYDGPTLRRLVAFMTTQKGTTLRSIVRKSGLHEPLRFPVLEGENHWRAYLFHMILLAAGPAIGVNRTLYRRWQRRGSLTRSSGWNHKSMETLLKGREKSTELSLSLFDRCLPDPREVQIAGYCLGLFQMIFIRRQQLCMNLPDVDSFSFRDSSMPDIKEGTCDQDVESWIRDAENTLKCLNADIAERRKDSART